MLNARRILILTVKNNTNLKSIFICKRTIFFSYLFVLGFLTLLMFIGNCDYLYAFVLISWVTMMFYCLNKLTERIGLFCYGIAFFAFLLGRDGMVYLFGFDGDVSKFSSNVNQHAYISLLLGLTGVWFSYMYFYKDKYHRKKIVNNSTQIKFYDYVRHYSLIAFYIVYPFAILVNLAIAYFVIKFGYAAKFTDLRSLVENTPIFYTISKIELLLPTAFSVFMATLPDKKNFVKIVKPYLFYLLLTLGTGGRGDFILGILLIIIFMGLMQNLEPNIVWIDKRKMRLALIIGVPVIAIGGSLMNIVRFGQSAQNVSILESFPNFFYEQGVTCNAIKNAYIYEDKIPQQKDLYTLEFLHTGLPARILGNKVYQGNNLDHATKGGSFTHALGYTIMGHTYLSGQGTGTSYIAELYYDFGYIGIFFGSCIYGYIFSLINNFRRAGLFSRSIVFIIITKLLWAPRGAFSGFLSFIFAPTTIALLLFVFAAAQISYVSFLKKQHHKISTI